MLQKEHIASEAALVWKSIESPPLEKKESQINVCSKSKNQTLSKAVRAEPTVPDRCEV